MPLAAKILLFNSRAKEVGRRQQLGKFHLRMVSTDHCSVMTKSRFWEGGKADLTDARSIPQELERIVPRLPPLPIQPIIAVGRREWGTYDFEEYRSVLTTHEYHSATDLLANLDKRVIAPAERKAKEIARRRAGSSKPSRR